MDHLTPTELAAVRVVLKHWLRQRDANPGPIENNARSALAKLTPTPTDQVPMFEFPTTLRGQTALDTDR